MRLCPEWQDTNEGPLEEREVPDREMVMLDLILLLLIAKMGDVSFVRREAAAALLRAYGETALPALRLAAEQHADPEVRRRAKGLLDDWWASFYRPSTYDRLPWLDMLPDAHAGRAEVLACHVLPSLSGGEWACYQAPLWSHYRTGTARYIEDLIEEGWTRAEVVALLDRMADREREYLRQHAHARGEQ